MSDLVLIRHGQAAAFSEDSDRLTDLGKRQAAVLGEFFVEQGITFDEVIMGGLRRHAQTEAEVAGAFARAGKPWPNAKVLPGWNEYDAGVLLTLFGKQLGDEDPAFAQLVADFEAAAARPDRNRYFQRMFEVLMAKWTAGAVHAEGVESYASFHARVSAAIDDVLATAGSRRIAVFTSGGPVGVCVQRTLKAPDYVALEVNWRVRNASLTEFVFGKGRVSLDTFNVTSHFKDASLLSFR